MPGRRKRSRRSRLSARGRVIAAVAVLVLLIAFVDMRLRPIVETVAANNARGTATLVINDTVTRLLAREDVTYHDLVRIEKDTDGGITAIETDISKVNSLKSEISAEVMKAMSELNTQQLVIPVGTLFGGELFTGRGPKLPLKLMISNSVLSEFKNNFDEAGINQTRHEIMLELTADIYVVLPGYKTSAQVKTNISVAETIIVGKVPNTYADLNGLDQVLR